MCWNLMRNFVKSSCPKLWKCLALRWHAARESREYMARAKLVRSCPDNARIMRQSDAGRVYNGLQIMHNGIKVMDACYYGTGGRHILVSNGGCHEPQEEVVFDAVIRHLRPGSVMLELGAYWGFYSMWFARDVQDSRVFLVEPEDAHLEIGRKNFEINALHGDFTHAFVGAEDGLSRTGTPVRCVESLAAEKGLAHIAMLHSDIQGHELEMLKGAKSLMVQRRVDFLFISTHSAELHHACAEFLKELGYIIMVSVDLEESYSFDGILVAHAPGIPVPSVAHPSKRKSIASKI